MRASTNRWISLVTSFAVGVIFFGISRNNVSESILAKGVFASLLFLVLVVLIYGIDQIPPRLQLVSRIGAGILLCFAMLSPVIFPELETQLHQLIATGSYAPDTATADASAPNQIEASAPSSLSNEQINSPSVGAQKPRRKLRQQSNPESGVSDAYCSDCGSFGTDDKSIEPTQVTLVANTESHLSPAKTAIATALLAAVRPAEISIQWIAQDKGSSAFADELGQIFSNADWRIVPGNYEMARRFTGVVMVVGKSPAISHGGFVDRTTLSKKAQIVADALMNLGVQVEVWLDSQSADDDVAIIVGTNPKKDT